MENKNFTEKYMDEQEKGEMKMAEEIEIIEEIEEVEEMERYIPESELLESKKIMKGRTLYTINKNMEIVETVTVRCNPSSYSYDALKLFLDNNMNVLEDYFNDENNHGIAYHECGYSGKAQDEFIQSWLDENVKVF